MCPGKGGKPSILLTKDWRWFIGNPTDEELVVKSGDLVGFYTGGFEIKIIRGCLVSFHLFEHIFDNLRLFGKKMKSWMFSL